ncbi:MAG: profilin [Bacteroidia bacterium]
MWDHYIDHLIDKSEGHIDKACLIELDGGSKLTTDNHPQDLKISSSEAGNIATLFKNNNLDAFSSTGISAGGVNYQFLRQEDDKIALGKKKDLGALTLQKSNTKIIIAHTREGGMQGNSNKSVNGLADYFESIGM